MSQESRAFSQAKVAKQENPIRQENIEWSSEGQKIHGSIFYPEQLKDKNPALLFLHGWKGNQTGNMAYAQEAAKEGFIGMTFDIRGHGTSEGNADVLTREQFVRDAEVAFEKLTESKGVDPEDITVIGASFGSYIAALLAQKKGVANLVLRAPANYPDDHFEEPIANVTGTPGLLEWRKKPLDAEATRSLQGLHGFKGNILLIESENDELVPHQTVANYANAVVDQKKLTHTVMQGASHSLTEPRFWTEYQKILLDWLKANHPEQTETPERS